MKTKNWKKIFAVLAAAALLGGSLAACSSDNSSDSETSESADGVDTEEEEVEEEAVSEEDTEDSEFGEREVWNEENLKVKLTIPEGLYGEESLKTGDLENDDDVLYYSRFIAYRPDVDYSYVTVSEMLFDIFIEDISDEVSDDDDEIAEYLDVATVQLVASLSESQRETVEREENETWNGTTYRVISYSGSATDGTTYKATYRMGVLNGCYLTFRTVEYTGSDYYVTYTDMSEICQEVYNSVKIINMQ